eukprot:TRINITY_DN6989_c0_g2_i1.p1 TRINITY_DN6989_c0_g2~~TRINITY_DN6989_c0_g2_i1.p1  ORF type:complete len:194 (-),score=39.44 TRINITY_DN6989_c0_g2_i1:69-650(-)
MASANFDARASEKMSVLGGYDFTKAAHPWVALVSVIFKALSLFFYIVIYYIWRNPIPLIIVIIAAAVDFWVNKNVCGRILVGLRWWKELQEDGKDNWIFECKVDETKNNPIDSNIFWGGQMIFGLFWIAIIISNLFSWELMKVMVNGFVLAMILTNLLAYYKCSKVQQKRIGDFVVSGAAQAAANQVMKGQPF